jgi:hypothetical protein
MTSRVLRNFLSLLAVLAVLVSPVLAQGRGQGNAHKQKDNNRGGVQTTVPVFGPRDRDLIGSYYRNRYSNLPPGLAKRGGNLPPGLERQLERNGTLPPELSRQLPPLPSGYTRGVIGGSAVIFNQRTRVIVDITAVF